ncbi:hypothetical protein [Shewanella japonica]|uniref:hypothetical protein n=1 Tax=Shewanella japonica TaxID=93973 RepID=UPI0012DD2D45|nr:hypothetical protein [Shewanella japonica]
MAVNADGTYSVDNVDLSTLVDGDITVVATATDQTVTIYRPMTLKTLMPFSNYRRFSYRWR